MWVLCFMHLASHDVPLLRIRPACSVARQAHTHNVARCGSLLCLNHSAKKDQACFHQQIVSALLMLQCCASFIPLLLVLLLQDTVGEFKERLSGVLGVPGNKMKLSREGMGFLKDEPSLAHYNVAPDVVLQLGLKERGRGKKGG